MSAKEIRMWELIPQEDGVSMVLEGVIKDAPKSVRTGDCYVPITKTIRTSLITNMTGSIIHTENGGSYRLVGKSRPIMILEAAVEKPCVRTSSDEYASWWAENGD